MKKTKNLLPLLKGRTAWYELVEYFDADSIQALPMKEGRAFLMGQLTTNPQITIVQVCKGTSPKAARQLGEWLSSAGIEALIVEDGVRFLRLRRCGDEEIVKFREGLTRLQQAQQENIFKIPGVEPEEQADGTDAKTEGSGVRAARGNDAPESVPEGEGEAVPPGSPPVRT